MVRLLFFFATVLMFLQTSAQEIVGEIVTRSTYVDSISIFPVKDSILVKFKDENKPKARFVYRWLRKDGTYSNVNYWQDIKCAFQSDSTIHLFYHSTSGDGLEISELRQKGMQIKAAKTKLKLEGKILTQFIDNAYYFILYKPNLEMLEILEIHNVDSVKRNFVKIPPHLLKHFRYRNESKTYIGNRPTNFFVGTDEIKFYKDSSEIVITINDYRKRLANIQLLRLNLNTGFSELKIIEGPYTEPYGSFYKQGKLFCFTIDEVGSAVEIFDVATSKLVASTYLKQFPESLMLYTRVRNPLLTMSHKPARSISKLHKIEKLVAVYSDSTGKDIIKCGFNTKNPTVGVFAPLILPALPAVAVFIATTAIFESNDLDGVTSYMYSVYDGKSVRFVDRYESIHTKLDDAEIKIQEEDYTRFSHRFYMDIDSDLLGVYKMRKDNKIQFRLFRN